MRRELGLNYNNWLNAVEAAKRTRTSESSGRSRAASRPKTYDEYADIVDADVVTERSSRNRSDQRRERPVFEERQNPDWERLQRNISGSVSDYQRSRRERRQSEAYADQPEEDTLEFRLSQHFGLGCGGLSDGSFFTGIVLIVIGSALFYASR